MAEIPLAKAIESLREQLGEAMVAGQGKPLQFTLKEIHLELTVAITKSGEGTAQVGLWNILTLGSKGDYNKATTHTQCKRDFPGEKGDNFGVSKRPATLVSDRNAW